MKRRHFLTTTAAEIAAGAAGAATAAQFSNEDWPEGFPDLITVDTPRSWEIQVFNRETGEVMQLVQAAHRTEGWIDQVRTIPCDPTVAAPAGTVYRPGLVLDRRVCMDAQGDVIVDRVFGSWGARLRDVAYFEREEEEPQVYESHQVRSDDKR